MKRNKKGFYTLLLSQICYGLFLFIWMVFTGLSAMIFDGPGSETNLGLLAIFYSIAAYPLGLLVGVIMSWRNYVRGNYQRAYRYNYIPLIWVVSFIGLIVYVNSYAS